MSRGFLGSFRARKSNAFRPVQLTAPALDEARPLPDTALAVRAAGDHRVRRPRGRLGGHPDNGRGVGFSRSGG